MAISATVVEEWVATQVRLLQDAAQSTASDADDVTAAYEEWQQAEQLLATKQRVVLESGIEDEAEAIRVLSALREDRDAKRDRYQVLDSRQDSRSVALTL